MRQVTFPYMKDKKGKVKYPDDPTLFRHTFIIQDSTPEMMAGLYLGDDDTIPNYVPEKSVKPKPGSPVDQLSLEARLYVQSTLNAYIKDLLKL